jgi:hypothetical protein
MNVKKTAGLIRVMAALAVMSGLFVFPHFAEATSPQFAPVTRTDIRSDIPEFEELFRLIRQTLSHNKVTFQGKTGMVSGFAAGSAYPQIWLRDSATIVPASRLFYEAPYLRSWLEEHLAFQKSDGSLADWVDSRGTSDKNTTETDQETSAVRSAGQVVRILGKDWLEKRIGGETILSRLDRALQFVLSRRFDKTHGLVTGAHTADWGDVDMDIPDQKAIYVGPKTHWTCDIYDQAQFYGAARELAEMSENCGQADIARFWNERAGEIRKNAERWLWQEARGFYRVHIHLDSLRHNFDEDGMFAMGGNAEAVISGLASGEKAKKIFENALARQKTYGFSTISGSLLPPYPKGLFKHPLMDDPYEYQNGGQWDWFGAKLVYAMFERGFSRTARQKLLEIAKKGAANKGLYEWDTPAGRGQGSAFYSGSAGSLGLALVEGYFGLKISKDSLQLSPRLADGRASVQVLLPAAGVQAAYDYAWDSAKKTLVFRFRSNLKNRGEVKILLPADLAARISTGKSEGLKVSLDGVAIPFRRETSNEDTYLVITADVLNHILEIK